MRHAEPDVEHVGPVRRRRTPPKKLPPRLRPTEDDVAMTLEEIGHALGLTRERVRQIVNQALAKAERLLRARGLTLRDLVDAMERGGHREQP